MLVHLDLLDTKRIDVSSNGIEFPVLPAISCCTSIRLYAAVNCLTVGLLFEPKELRIAQKTGLDDPDLICKSANTSMVNSFHAQNLETVL